jgi:hypothetical protein
MSGSLTHFLSQFQDSQLSAVIPEAVPMKNSFFRRTFTQTAALG